MKLNNQAHARKKIHKYQILLDVLPYFTFPFQTILEDLNTKRKIKRRTNCVKVKKKNSVLILVMHYARVCVNYISSQNTLQGNRIFGHK